MKHLYLFLDLGSVIIPLLFSFHPKIRFDRQWKRFFPATVLTAIIFLVWDEYFTRKGVWGFNPEYLMGPAIGQLPLEEILFFICIPYACIFSHHALKSLVPDWTLSGKTGGIILLIMVSAMIGGLIYTGFTHLYTLFTFSSLLLVLIYSYLFRRELLYGFLPSYLLMLIPFFLINGVLTGSWIEAPVVWYNNAENMGIRLGTVPVEDLFYAFELLFVIVLFMDRRRK